MYSCSGARVAESLLEMRMSEHGGGVGSFRHCGGGALDTQWAPETAHVERISHLSMFHMIAFKDN